MEKIYAYYSSFHNSYDFRNNWIEVVEWVRIVQTFGNLQYVL
jgi:hypothetical protein